MTTPVLSKKQHRKVLSGKKTPAKGLRNVLAQPYNFSWPIIRNDDIGELKILLETFMPAVRRPSLGIPWSHLQRLKKTERQAAREEVRAKLDIPVPDQNILNSIVLGINEVTRLLEKNDGSCILLEVTVEPRLLVKHIVVMAELKNVPLILVPCLKNVTLETIGFACVAVALKKIVAEQEDHHFHSLYKKVVELSTNFHRSKPLKLDLSKPDKSSAIVNEIVINPDECHDKQKVVPNNSVTLSTDIYKYRNSQKERVFVPENVEKSEFSTGRIDDDFIGIGEDSYFTNDQSFIQNKSKTRYVDIHREENKKSSEIKNSDTQFGVSEMSDKSLVNSKMNRVSTENKKHSKNFKYESLKVRRLQGNLKRVKATKIPKKNKK